MPRITYIEHDGTAHEIDVPVGASVMRGAVDNAVPGIDGDCGGQCACATCHVHVDAAWQDKVGARTETEITMLDFTAGAEENSRLACQITVSEALDGLIVRMPESQH